MKPPVARVGLPQYPELEDRIHDLATAVLDGEMDEGEARDLIHVAVYSSNLATTTVRGWLSESQLHLVDDMTAQADAWLMRAITGKVIGENMVDSGKPGATLMSLELIAQGSSAVGYLRKGLGMDMRKFMRTLERRTGLGANLHLIDTRVLSGAVDEQTTTALDHYAAAKVNSTSHSRDLLAEHDDMLAELAHSQYLEDTRGQSDSARTVARGQALQSFYRVPSAARPLSPSVRKSLLKTVTGELPAAHRSMKSKLAGQPTKPRGLGQLWDHYTAADIESILNSPKAVVAAQTLALVALSPRPRVPVSVQRKFRVYISRMFRGAGLAAARGTELAKSYLHDEHEQGEPGHQAEPWTALAKDLITHTPDLLGATPEQVRDGLTAALNACAE